MDRKKILIPIIIFTIIVICLLIILNSNIRYTKSIVNDTKWASIKDTRTENKELVLEDIEFNGYNLIIDENDDTLYYSLVNSSKNKYNPKISFTANNEKAKIAILSDDITDEKVKNNYRFKMMLYTDTAYHIYYLQCTDFPIINISYNENVENDKKNIPMEIYIFNNLSNTPNRITISRGKLRINEENYAFSLNMLTPGKNVRENKISILKMKPESEYALTKVQEDDKDSKKQIVELFINKEYKGLYSLGYIKDR